MTLNKLHYRPEVDGLRAIAVVPVLIYHAEFVLRGEEAFKGGFLGVDIFFVISGYLITSLIYRDLKQGSFSILDFYERRARRILPALFAVFLTTYVFSALILSPPQLVELSNSIISSVLFVSNFYFWQTIAYGDDLSSLYPLLHTWSLAIEEQFYIFFPIVLMLMTRFKARTQIIILAVLLLVSLQLAHLYSDRYLETTFYLLPFRAWELLAGSLLGVLHIQWGLHRFALPRGLMAGLGLLLIVVSFVFFTEDTQHPSYFTVVPVLGSVLLIWFAGGDDLVSRMLRSNPFVWIGRISYSLYLWHFPIFALARNQLFELSNLDRVVLLALTTVMAYLSYRFVETPFRHKFSIERSKLFALAGASGAALVGLSVVTTSFNGFGRPDAMAFSVNKLKEISLEAWRYQSCFVRHTELKSLEKPFEACKAAEAPSDKPQLFLIGNSHAAHLYPGLSSIHGDNFEIRQRNVTCPPIVDFGKPESQINSSQKLCRSVYQKVLQEVKLAQPAKILFSADWSGVWTELAFESIVKFHEASPKSEIIIVGPVPRWKIALPVALSKITSETGETPLYLTEHFDDEVVAQDGLLQELTKGHDFKYISPLSFMCDARGCLTLVGRDADTVTAWDKGHLSVASSVYVVRRLKL